MIEELKSIEKSHAWELITLPERKKTIDVKWIFKGETNLDGNFSRHKARLVARGFLQKYGIDYNEFFFLL